MCQFANICTSSGYCNGCDCLNCEILCGFDDNYCPRDDEENKLTEEEIERLLQIREEVRQGKTVSLESLRK